MVTDHGFRSAMDDDFQRQRGALRERAKLRKGKFEGNRCHRSTLLSEKASGAVIEKIKGKIGLDGKAGEFFRYFHCARIADQETGGIYFI